MWIGLHLQAINFDSGLSHAIAISHAGSGVAPSTSPVYEAMEWYLIISWLSSTTYISHSLFFFFTLQGKRLPSSRDLFRIDYNHTRS